MTKKIPLYYKHKTFFKIWPVLFAIFCISFIFSVSGRNEQEILIPNDEAENFNAQEIAETVLDSMESMFVYSIAEKALQILDELDPDPAITRNRFENVLAENPYFICITIWLENRNWPIHVIQNEFWDTVQSGLLTDEQRRNMFNFLFPDERIQIADHLSWTMGKSELLAGFESIIYTLHYPVHNMNYIQADFKYKIPDSLVTHLFSQNRFSNIKIAVFNENDMPVFTFPDNFNPDTKTHENQTIVSFTHLPWKLVVFDDHIPAVQTIGKTAGPPILVLLSVSLILSFILSAAVSKWINQPINRLCDQATEIAGGNFSELFPPQKDSRLDKLVRVFNYMASEMDRFQDLNVSEIISEKDQTETILRTIADGVIVTDVKHRILLINSTAEHWLDLKEKDNHGKSIFNILNVPGFKEILQDISKGTASSSVEFSYMVKGSRKAHTFLAHSARLQNEYNEFQGIVSIIRDISREKEADQVKTELVSMVAHELKSPLTSIYGFSELLLETEASDPQFKEYIQVILGESTRLTDLVNKFLDLSRLEAGKTKINFNPFDIKQLIEKIVDIHGAHAENKKIRVILDIPDNLAFAYGDPDLIEQVLVNLYNNAIKYSPSYSKIGIEIREEEDHLKIQVIDNGYGIPKESIPYIFDKFYRVVDNDDSEEIEGSGLGLALVWEIIEQHEGTISVSSRLGVGSVFTFTLKKTELA